MVEVRGGDERVSRLAPLELSSPLGSPTPPRQESIREKVKVTINLACSVGHTFDHPMANGVNGTTGAS